MATSARLPILMYHAVHPERSLISVTPAVFEWQMGWLHSQGYRTLSLGGLVRCLQGGLPLPERTVALTFDDGFASLYEHAFPVLQRFGFTATIFLVTSYCGGRNDWPGQPGGVPTWKLLDWDRIREMDRGGIEFGAHTLSHPRLDRLNPDAQRREILESKAAIEEQLGHTVEQFAYPYGQFDQETKAIVEDAFAGACSTQLGFVNPQSDPLEMERIEVSYFEHPLLFRRLGGPFSLPYLAARRTLRTVAAAALGRAWR